MLGPLLLGSADMWGPPEAPAEMLLPVLRPPHFACLTGVSGLATAPPQRGPYWAWQGPGEFIEFLDSVGSAPQGFPCSSGSKDSARNAGDSGSIPGWERSPGEGNGNPLQYSHLGNSTDGGAWWATVHGSQRVGRGWATKHTHMCICMHVCVCLSVCIEAP